MIDHACVEAGLKLIGLGYYVFPLAENTKLPPKGHHGYKEASNLDATVYDWYEEHPTRNLGLNLKQSGLVVIDVDMHTEGKNGRETLLKLSEQGLNLPADTYIEKTPNDGLHYFFKTSEPIKKVIDFKPGIDVISDFVVIAPSEINGVAYHPLGDKTMADIKPLPSWIIDQLNQKQPRNFNYRPSGGKRWTGQLLDEIVQDAGEGNRNTHLTRLCGKMLRTGAEPETVYYLLEFANKFQYEALNDTELGTIFNSILKKEMSRWQKA